MLTARLSVNGATIATAEIVNLGGPGNPEVADYRCRFLVPDPPASAPRVVADVRVEGFRRDRGAWALVAEAVRVAGKAGARLTSEGKP